MSNIFLNKKNNKKITIITPIYDQSIGGAWSVMRYLSENLVKKNYFLEVHTMRAKSLESITQKPNYSLLKEEIVNGVFVNRYDYIPLFYKFFNKVQKISFNKFYFIKFFYFAPLGISSIKIFLKDPGNWIISTQFLSNLYGYILSKIYGSKHIIIPFFHKGCPLNEHPLNIWLLKKSYLLCVFSKYEKQALISRDIPAEKIKIIRISYPEFLLNYYKHFFKRSKKEGESFESFERDTILFLGRHEEYKNIILLLEIMSIYVWPQKKVNLIIAGERTNFTNKIKEYVEKLPLKQRRQVFILESINEEFKWSILRKSHVLVNLSLFESFSLVFIEAWLCKKPVIGVKESVAKFIIKNKKDGLLVSIHNKKEIGKSILFMLLNKKSAKTMGINGFKKAQTYIRYNDMASEIDYLLNQC